MVLPEITTNGSDTPGLEDLGRYNSAWRSYNISRYKQFAKQTLHGDLSTQPDDFEPMKGWGPSLQSTRQVRQIMEPAAEYLSRDTDGDICLRCCGIDFKEMIESASDWYKSAYPLGERVQVVQNPSCRICGLLGCLLQEYRTDGKNDDTCLYLAAFPTSALYGKDWTWQGPPDGVTQTTSFSIFDEITFRDLSRVRQPYLVRAIGCISPVPEKECLTGFQARKLGDKVEVAVVKAWMNYCSHNHQSSCTSDERPLHPSTKVIDCRSNIVVPLENDHTYLALSYVWGKAKDVEAEAERGTACDATDPAFPQTVNDAITLTKELGYSYLWVDRFCIPQDQALERQMQIAQMDRIYAGAEATIIAAAGDDPSYGLPGIRKRRSYTSRSATINGQMYTVVPPDPSHEIRGSRWNSRAWTYQESMLSKRRIMFCDRQVYFECSAMHCYEAMRAPLHLLHSSLCSRFSEWNEPGIFPVEQHRHALDHLFHHLALYTVRELSYPNDILNGMLGIFAAFTQQPIVAKLKRSNRRITQIAGVPIVPNDTLVYYNPIDPPVYHLSREGQFITGLSWKLVTPAQRRSSFPSWSWTGWYGAVEPRNDYEGYVRNTHGLEIEFTTPEKIGHLTSSIDLNSILDAYQRKDLGPDYIPALTVTGETIAIHVAVAQYGLQVRRNPTGLAAFMDTEDEGFYAADRFYLTYADPRLLTSSPKTFEEDCIGLILGMAQCTYFAGADGRTRVLQDSTFPLVILVLWKRDGRWERLGLIEHTISIRTDSNPIPVGSGGLRLRTERKCLRLG
ncbi:tol protein [Stagonosporopsis vannaccii]|nr:tol protein [Stagonosporopsis vannaccii]